MNFPLLISVATVAIAASVFFLAWLNYRTSLKMPNENKLYEEKIRSYQTVIRALNITAGVYIECANEMLALKVSGQGLRKAKDELNNELDKVYYQMEDTISEQLLLVPDEVLDRIDDYFDQFDREDFLEEIKKAGKTEEFEDTINGLFDEMINAMREDLAFEKLNTRLKKRIGSRHRSHQTSEDTA